LVKSIKERLAAKVGWFHSKNYVGLITIYLFTAMDTTIETVKNKLAKLCAALIPEEVSRDGFDFYPNGAFYITLDAMSKKRLKLIMRHIQ
jgi:hypothetical protein